MNDTEKQVYCSKCGKPQGVLKFDEQVFEVGNVQFFCNTRYSCVCGKPKTFFPKPIANSTKGFDDETKTVLNGLGLNKKYTGLRQPRSKKLQEDN